jgi:hypothetical protein
MKPQAVKEECNMMLMRVQFHLEFEFNLAWKLPCFHPHWFVILSAREKTLEAGNRGYTGRLHGAPRKCRQVARYAFAVSANFVKHWYVQSARMLTESVPLEHSAYLPTPQHLLECLTQARVQ